MRTRRLISIVSLLGVLLATPALADGSTNNSQGSADLSAASGLIVGGSADIFAGSGQMVVSSVEIVGESVIVVLRGASDAAPVALELSGEVIRGAALAAGAFVQVTAEATGYLLSTAGKAIAYIPNERGRSLLHRSHYRQRI